MNVVIFGATSAIASATARSLAKKGHTLFLVGRNTDRLTALCSDLKITGANDCNFICADFTDTDSLLKSTLTANEHLKPIDICIVAHGTLTDQKKANEDSTYLQNEIQLNAVSTALILNEIASIMEQQKSGTIVAISSVAGDRGRQSNYAYGASKAMVSTFLKGLRNRLYPSGVQVIDIKPGFVDTPMTKEFSKGPLWSQPSQIAQIIEDAIISKRKTVYAPFFWRWIMLIIRSIPEFIFVRLKL